MKVHLIGAAICLACIAASYIFGLKPVLDARSHLNAVASESKELQLQQEMLAGTSDKLEAELKGRRIDFRQKFSVEMPNQQSLIQTVSIVLQRNGAELINLREQVDREQDEVTLSLQLEGSYGELVGLIDELTRLERPNHIRSLRLIPKSNDRDIFSASLDVVFSKSVEEPKLNLDAVRELQSTQAESEA